ncbi:Pyrazinamidase/nicotinamidase [Thraustotheca clavata]|uniref:nicotinamidase n=1 Tax=Thraustotheca clavata TaxID=74557 RepID=A0A0A7CMG0_9STRA|nr:secreted protein [Thraustotheca clavata]OQR93105.1 Pyrazinamidase/nicotinamidase [Thraustotheca clavata]
MARFVTAVLATAASFVFAHDHRDKTAFIVVDVQNDFALPSGNLSVTGGETIIPTINKLRQNVAFDMVVRTQDWHPLGHCSFYSAWASDPNARIFEAYTLPWGMEQVLWPNHCTQNQYGAQFHKDLIQKESDVIIQKGTNVKLDSYSALLENDHKTETQLPKILKDAGIKKLVVVGLAEDYCVGSTAYDAKTVYDLEVVVISDATAAVAVATQKTMQDKLKAAGVKYQTSVEYLEHHHC